MAAPVDSARQNTNITTAGTSHAINVGSPVAGTLLIVFVRFAGAPGTVTFTGYTQLASDTSDASDDQTMIFYRDANGTEGATDTLTTGNSIKLAAICWEITDAETGSRSAPVVSTVAVGTTTADTANPNSAAPTGGSQDTLYLALMGLDGEGNAPSAAPTNYSNLVTATSGTGGAVATNCSVGGGSRQISASSSDDPGAFTHAAANAGWTAYTLAIHGPGLFADDANRAVTDTGGSNTTTPSFNVPSGVEVGELLVLMWRAGGNVISITNNAGFTQLVLSSADGTDDDFYVGYKIADGTEGSSVQFTVSNGRRFAGVMYRINNGGTPVISSVGTGSGTSIDPASFSPAGGVDNYLWIPIGTCEDARTVSAFPTNYVNGAQENVSTGADGATCATASRQVQSATVNPGAFVITVTSNNHMHATVAIPYEADPDVRGPRHPAANHSTLAVI